ncbi:hypothetical protein Tco_0589115 [Tanacetum coccineum]
MDASEKLMPNNGQAISQLEYSRVLGCLMYAMTCKRPNASFVVGKLSRYNSNPSTQHWQASKKQTCITSSTIESEFVALAATGKDNKTKGSKNSQNRQRNGEDKTRVKNEAKSIKSRISLIQEMKSK